MSELSTDLKSVADQIKEKIQAQASSLIPEEVYKKIVDSGVDSLLKKEDYKRNPITDQAGRFSPLELMIFNEIMVQVRNIVKDYFEQPEIRTKIFGNGSMTISDIVKETLTENSDQIMKNFMMSIMGNAMMDSLTGVRQSLLSMGIQPRF